MSEPHWCSCGGHICGGPRSELHCGCSTRCPECGSPDRDVQYITAHDICPDPFHQSDTESEEDSMDKREKHDTDEAGRHRPDCWCR